MQHLRTSPLGPALLLLLFVVTRLVTYVLWQHPSAEFVANDVGYYGFHLHHLSEGADDVMREYPPPAVWILQLIYTVGGGWETWQPLYAATMLVLDGAVAASLIRRDRMEAALFWILFTAANGAIVWFRFDLIPAALVAWACVFLVTRPAVTGALVGAGAAIKFWPALLLLPMLAPEPLRRPGRDRVLGFLAMGGGLGVVSLAIEGWTRNTDPLTWQGDRGLQIESIPATGINIIRTYTDSPHWTVRLSDYNALELFGPGVDAMLTLSTVLTVGSILLTVALAVLLIRRRAEAPAVLLAMLAVVLATIVANKTLSPQYVLWLGGPVAALLLSDLQPRLRRHVVVLAVTLVVVGGLTQYTYPWGAYGIMAIPLGSGPEMAVLVLRNLTLIAMLVHVVWLTAQASATKTP